MVVVPFPERLKVSAHMVDLKVGPLAFDTLVRKLGECLEREDADVTLAHEILPQCLDAVVCSRGC